MDSPVLAAAAARVLEDIHASNFARLELVVWHDAAPPPAASASPDPAKPDPDSLPAWRRKLDLLRDPARRQHILFSLYSKRDRANSPAPSPDDPVDCSPFLEHVPSLRVRPDGKKFVHRFPADALEKIAAFDLDVLLRFGFNILRGGILRAARYGLWSFHHGDNDAYRGGPALFWEIAEQNPESGVILQVLEEALDDGVVLCKSVFPTEPGYSWSRNRFGPYWGSTHFVIERLWHLHNYGWEHTLSQAAKSGEYRGKQAIYRTPTNTAVARWLAPAIVRKAAQRLTRRPVRQHWKTALRPLPAPDSGLAAPLKLQDFDWIESPKSVFWADPVLCEWRGETHLFVEEYDYAAQRGRLAVARVDDPQRLHFQTCLEEPFHLSYPCVFAHDGELYMIPESQQTGEVRLYVAEDYPLRWKLRKVLLQIPAVDATPYFDGARWWLFVTTCGPLGFCPSLLLFSASHLEGPWTHHPANPLSGHLENVRNAGPVFAAQGKVYRPSQSGRGGYGANFSLSEIVTLNEREYAERRACTTLPMGVPGIAGTHTYTRTTRWEAVDGVFPEPL